MILYWIEFDIQIQNAFNLNMEVIDLPFDASLNVCSPNSIETCTTFAPSTSPTRSPHKTGKRGWEMTSVYWASIITVLPRPLKTFISPLPYHNNINRWMKSPMNYYPSWNIGLPLVRCMQGEWIKWVDSLESKHAFKVCVVQAMVTCIAIVDCHIRCTQR